MVRAHIVAQIGDAVFLESLSAIVGQEILGQTGACKFRVLIAENLLGRTGHVPNAQFVDIAIPGTTA